MGNPCQNTGCSQDGQPILLLESFWTAVKLRKLELTFAQEKIRSAWKSEVKVHQSSRNSQTWQRELEIDIYVTGTSSKKAEQKLIF